jgi:hypothetical protein
MSGSDRSNNYWIPETTKCYPVGTACILIKFPTSHIVMAGAISPSTEEALQRARHETLFH